MARSKESPGSAAYFDALQKVFQLQSEFLTAVLPHAGERGTNDEERCRTFLSQVLPRRYSIGSGFVVSSDPELPVSRQQDVVIFDDFLNSPLHRELSASVFPIEMVYATVEVKGLLQPNDLLPIVQSIGGVRQLSMQCWYEIPESPTTPKLPNVTNLPGRFKLARLSMKRPPRAFVFAFNTTYSTPDGLKDALQRAIDEGGFAHLHGIVVLNKGWFAFQYPNKPRAEIKIFTDNALLRFVNNMLMLLKGTVIREAEMARYLKIETAESEPDENKK